MFCIDDSMLCCLKCVQFGGIHEKHNFLQAAEAKEKLAVNIRQSQNQLQELLERIQKSKASLELKISHGSQEEEAHTRMLLDFKQELFDAIDQNHLKQVKSLQTKYAELRQEIKGRLARLNTVLEAMRGYTEQGDGLFLLQASRELELTKPETLLNNLPEVCVFVREEDCFRQILDSSCLIELESASGDTIASTETLVYLTRGSKDYTLYDFETGLILPKSIVNTFTIPRWSGFTVLSNGEVLVTGGKADRDSGAMTNVFKLDPRRGHGEVMPHMLYGHSSHVVIRDGDRIYCLTGKSQANVTHTVCEYFDLPSQTWNKIASMVNGRTCAAGAALGNSLFVMGGFQTTLSNSIERYHIQENVWNQVETCLPHKLWQHGVMPISKSQLLIFGGETERDEIHQRSLIYSPATNDFYNVAELPPFSNCLFFWLQVARVNQELYSINKDQQVIKYCILSNTWTLL